MNVQREKGGDTTIAKVTVKEIVHQKKTKKVVILYSPIGKSELLIFIQRKWMVIYQAPKRTKIMKVLGDIRQLLKYIEVQRNKINMRIG